MTPGPESLYLTEASLAKKLERARDELLDLSARNRLLNMPRHSKAAQNIEVIDEKASEVYRLLVRDGKALTFLPGKARGGQPLEEDQEGIVELALPEDDSRDGLGVLTRHAETKLQTRLTGAGLQKRLLNLYQDARTLEDEQGVNILYLALGTLRWIDPHHPEAPRYAPLILVPVSLDRASAKERFRMRWRQEDCSSNLSLDAFLDRVHFLSLPVFTGGDDFDYDEYVRTIADAARLKEHWSVQPDDISLGIFSYAKFLMYRDLDPANWPAGEQFTEHPLIRMVLQDGFPESGEQINDEQHLDEKIHPAAMRHIHDSDSSQVLAAHDVRQGTSLVIQGPPGTGKSQTIANLIGEAIADGKTVLFVSEKMAALEVVKRRLDKAGVGDACLELHSNKANKKALLAELRRTWELGAPKGPSADVADQGIVRARRLLNGHVFRMHRVLPANGLTPYEAIGHLARIQRLEGITGDLQLAGADQWNAEDRRERLRLAQEIARWIEMEGLPSEHAWWCVGLESILPIQAEHISRTAQELSGKLRAADALQRVLAHELDAAVPEKLKDFDMLAVLSERVSTAPESMGAALGSPEWERAAEIRELIAAGQRLEKLEATLVGQIAPNGWSADIDAAHAILSSLPGHLSSDWLARVERLNQLIPQLADAANSAMRIIGLTGECANTADVRKLLETVRHIASAPAAAPQTFTAAAWDHGVERAMDLVGAVVCLEAARQKTEGRISEAAWEGDCSVLRQTLAAHGTGLLRWLRPAWRRADRTVKSWLSNPATALADVLVLLDAVASGQKARGLIRQGDEFGASAFGPLWRGERSSAAPLRAVAEWARSLGPRSREVRELAARISDTASVRVCLSCLEAIWVEFDPLLSEIFSGFGQALSQNVEQIGLEELRIRTAAIATAETICRQVFRKPPDSVSERAERLDNLAMWRETGSRLAGWADLARQCFGELWKGTSSAWAALAEAADWVARNRDIRHVAARFDRPEELLTRNQGIRDLTLEVISRTEALFRELRLDTIRLFGSARSSDIAISELALRVERWGSRREDLSKWVAYAGRVRQARELGISEAVKRLECGQLEPKNAQIEIERACYWAVLMTEASANPELARFDGGVHQGQVEELVRLEEEHRDAARVSAMRAHYQRLPHGGAGPVGLLKAEIARKRGHMPIRQLMSHAGAAIQALKPVLMMSPLSVAQFLTPGEMKFDLLVMDEASQIQPVDALGAIARCRQAVVVGDERQLPPTRFFARMTGGNDDDDADAAQVADVESILGLFLARGAPQRTLRWHYRSEHHALIAVSNREFYNGKLCILPSPYTSASGRGIRFHLVPGGTYDSGNTRTNVIEARRVAQAVIEHAQLCPGQTLGVGTFSVAQRRAIVEQLELLRRAKPDSESFFTSHPHEPFFIKNLENIQGDERDVIFISVGYAKNAAGQMSMNFGPLSNHGGERRLNVLITRARRRCEVFSSITDQEIVPERSRGAGVAAFQLFLRFARTGQMEDVHDLRQDSKSGRAIEEDIANALRGRGYEVDTAVGISGAFIDIAVLDPGIPGRYVIGIECDGLSYSSARSARDRDRLRREALERQGWRLHRVWSMDWYQRPAEQLERIVCAIEQAKQRWAEEMEDEKEHISENAVEREERHDAFVDSLGEVVPYIESSPAKPLPASELLETSPQALAAMVAEIVAVEGPIHQDEVVVRVRSVWGLQRAGARIQEHLAKAIRLARGSRGIEREGKFLSIQGRVIQVRNRSNVLSRSLRLPEMLPPAEIRAGIASVIRENFGAREEEIVATVLRQLGYATSGSSLREVVQTAIRKMQARGEIYEHGELLTLAAAVAGSSTA